MKHARIPFMIAALLLVGAGCASAPPPEQAENAPQAESPAATSTPETAATSTAETTNTNVNVPAPKPVNAPKPTTTGVKKTFYVELDDKGAYPAGGTAAKGSTVTVTFKVRPTNVFYNGLVVTSNAHDLGKINAGQSKTITFTAIEDETFAAQWITGTTKARWTLTVR